MESEIHPDDMLITKASLSLSGREMDPNLLSRFQLTTAAGPAQPEINFFKSRLATSQPITLDFFYNDDKTVVNK